ncbi:MAG: 30S ribosomal protein S13 [Candidatus Liptonbacteria bacterium]|nr:30S ribosomal protein S13 [Candidatus Liptonbacteria bacterium]
MRFIGVTIPDEKQIETALTYLYGIGRTAARDILRETKIEPTKRTKQLTPDEVNRMKTAVERDYKIEGELRQAIRQNIARLVDIGAYRGARHAKKLPVRGQRTKTNSRTVRGNVRKTAGSGKRKLELK